MPTSRLARLAPLTGVAFFVLMVVGVIMTSKDSPDFVGKPSEFAQYYADNSGRILGGFVFASLGVVFLLWFLGSLAARLRVAEGGDTRVSALALAGGVAGSTLLWASFATTAVAALRVDDQNALSDDMAGVYGDLSTALGFLAGPFAFGLCLAAIALVSFRTGVLPAWLTWLAAVFAVGLLVPPISWAVMALFGLWVLIASIVLYLDQPASVEAS